MEEKLKEFSDEQFFQLRICVETTNPHYETLCSAFVKNVNVSAWRKK